MSLIDLFKGFHRTAIQQEFPPSTRVLFDTIVFELNEEFWPDSLVFSERDLMYLTGLKKTTLHDAKHFLTSRHVIECKPFKNKFAYRLGDEFLQLLQKGNHQPTSQPTTNRPLNRPLNRLPTDQSTDHLTDQSSRSNTQLSITTQDKTKELKIKELSSDINARTRDTHTVNDLLEYWDDELRGGRLAMEHLAEINVLLKRYGFEWVKAAMKEAADANGSRFGLSMKLFRAVVETKAKAKSNQQLRLLKGGESSGKREYQYAKPPEYDFLDEFSTPR